MGLDMHLLKCKPTDLTSEDEFGFALPEGITFWKEIQYWRSRPDVHAVMEQIYRIKGGKEEFNWVNLRLRESDISAVENLYPIKAITNTTTSLLLLPSAE